MVSHPAFQGRFVAHAGEGIAHYALFGQLNRLAGADAAIIVNYGERFASTLHDCLQWSAGTSAPVGHIKPIFPAPPGSISLDRRPEMLRVYG